MEHKALHLDQGPVFPGILEAILPIYVKRISNGRYAPENGRNGEVCG